MSRLLYWRPAQPTKDALSDRLKFALREMHGEPVSLRMTIENATELIAMVACGVVDARDLLKAIEKFGEVEVFEE